MSPKDVPPLLRAVSKAKLFKYDRTAKLTKIWYGGCIVFEMNDAGETVGSYFVKDDAAYVYDFMRFNRW
jgi:hypothetical protein